MQFRKNLKILCLMISLLMLCWTSSLFAQTETETQTSKSKGDFIGHFDKDGDGKVSKDEFTGPEDHFTRLDSNNDGFIEQDEAPTGPPPHGNFIGRFDKDGDGKVSKDEFTGPEAMFTKLDSNNDGFIEQDEAPTGPPPRRGNPIQNFDKDGDGKLSKEEFPGHESRFDQFDTNKDGFLDESELSKSRLGGKRPRRGQEK